MSLDQQEYTDDNPQFRNTVLTVGTAGSVAVLGFITALTAAKVNMDHFQLSGDSSSAPKEDVSVPMYSEGSKGGDLVFSNIAQANKPNWLKEIESNQA